MSMNKHLKQFIKWHTCWKKILTNYNPNVKIWKKQTPRKEDMIGVMLKQVLRSLLLSYQKKAWLAPAKPSILLALHKDNTVQSYSWCHTKKRLGWDGASQVFFWYDNDKDLKTYFCMTRKLLVTIIGKDPPEHWQMAKTQSKLFNCGYINLTF